MAIRVFRRKMTRQEAKFWTGEEMDGWRKAFEECVEFDARDEKFTRYQILDPTGKKLIEGKVRKIVPRVEEEALN